LIYLGYDAAKTFLENIDLFLGHLLFKVAGLFIVFWAFYTHGFQYLRRSAFDSTAQAKKDPRFLVLGMIAAFVMAVISYSAARELLGLATSAGAIIGCALYIYEYYRSMSRELTVNVVLMAAGVAITWLLSTVDMIASSIAGLGFIVAFLLVRRKAIRRHSLRDLVEAEGLPETEARALQDVMYSAKTPINYKVAGGHVVEINAACCGLKAIPETARHLAHLEVLDVKLNDIETLPEAILGIAKTLKMLDMEGCSSLAYLSDAFLPMYRAGCLNIKGCKPWTRIRGASVPFGQ
jgi:hypothetical protein